MRGRRALTFEIALFALGAILWGISYLYDYETTPAFTASAAPPQANGNLPRMTPYTEPIPGTSVQFDMIPIQGGTFQMGSPASEPHRAPDEGPQHSVTVGAFWMGKAEVTWNEYDQFALARGIRKSAGTNTPQQIENEKLSDAVTRPTPPYADPTFGYGHDGYPAISMTHHAAMEYTRWLSAKTGKDYRLPTEAEWEYACRAGSKTAYSFGDDPSKLIDEAWFKNDSDDRPHSVAKKKPNVWGLYDMEGNVAEWVLDLYDQNSYKTFDALIPAKGPVLLPTEKEYPYVVRGGSWADDAPGLRCAARKASSEEWSRQDPQLPQSIWWHTDATFVGIRIVRPLDEQENLKGLKSKVKKLDN
jgi:formylglycine-generating enzyme required for sulfatase activity